MGLERKNMEKRNSNLSTALTPLIPMKTSFINKNNNMKLIKLFTLLFLTLLVLSTNCDKKETIEHKDADLYITINQNEVYLNDLIILGDEEGARIIKAPEHSHASFLVRDASTDYSIVYTYIPDSTYTGVDYVEIETCTGEDNIGCSHLDTLKIHFTITE